MDIKALGVSILQYMIANIPTIIGTFMILGNRFKKVDTQVSLFDKNLSLSKDAIVSKIEEKVSKLNDKFEDKMDKTIEKVDKTLGKSLVVLDSFGEKMIFLGTQVEYLTKSNKVAFDIIAKLVGDNDNLINNGVASTIVNKLSMTKKEMENYPELISSNKEAFVNALKEQYAILGKENFESILIDSLKDMGYGKEEELQVKE